MSPSESHLSMLHEYSSEAQAVINAARIEATGSQMTTGHLLLGLLSSRQGVAFNALRRAAVNYKDTKQQLSKIQRAEGRNFDDTHSDYVRKILKAAASGTPSRANQVQPEDILRAMLEQPESTALECLQELGVSIELLRKLIDRQPPASDTSERLNLADLPVDHVVIEYKDTEKDEK